MGDLARALLGEPTLEGREEWRFRAKGSLSVEVAGSKRGSWYDHEAGVGGDALGLVGHVRRERPERAARWAQDWLGGAPAVHDVPHDGQEAAQRPAKAPVTISAARRAWGEGQDAAGSLAEAYLNARGLAREPGLPLRFHPRCQRGDGKRGPPEFLPAMLALMTDPETGAPCGVHRTFLLPDGSGKAPPGPFGEPAKMMLGAAGVIRLSPDEEVTTRLGLAEGIETALSVMQGFGWRPVWAAASAGAIARFPVLAGIEALTIFADRDTSRFRGQDGHAGPDMPDGPGMHAARACGQRWREAGREGCIVSPTAGDWNDAHRRAA
ncbi:hypothetical protein EJV46_16100 [Roseococcus sp. SYP-B2431]|nr:hypothetical protein EJV46_16100 [Roseococcus sp. SYP-B2431]